MKKTILLMISLLSGACTTRGILAPLPHEAIGNDRYAVRCSYGVVDGDCIAKAMQTCYNLTMIRMDQRPSWPPGHVVVECMNTGR